MKVSPARLAALEVVRAVRERTAFAQDIIKTRIDKSSLSPSDRAFATKLALGVVSASGTLDDILNRALNKPSDVKADVRDALRLSVFEIFFLDKTSYAAVDQGVELVRSFAPKAAGLANAVLRKVVRLRPSFPFGDPSQSLEALARLYAFPEWLAAKLVSEMGLKAAVDFMKASNEPAPVFLAVNALKTTADAVVAAFEKEGQRTELIRIESSGAFGCIRVPDGRSLLIPSIKQLFTRGHILVSDAASQMVAASVLPREKPASFLEIGAGRATKTILLQSAAFCLWGSQIKDYVTLDNHAFKKKILLERARRYGVEVSQALTGNALKLGELLKDRLFDMVFIDAPCSGLGTLRRHPEIRWRIQPSDFVSFAQTQRAMLKAAATQVRVGGTLAYATCTVAREENIETVKAFLSSKEGQPFQLMPIAHRSCLATRLTTDSSDAHFAVRFARVE